MTRWLAATDEFAKHQEYGWHPFANKLERLPDFMNVNKKRIRHEQDYIEFLERRTKSANYKKNVSPEEYATTEAKLKKARLIMRVLKK